MTCAERKNKRDAIKRYAMYVCLTRAKGAIFSAGAGRCLGSVFPTLPIPRPLPRHRQQMTT